MVGEDGWVSMYIEVQVPVALSGSTICTEV